MKKISPNPVSLAGKFAVLSQLALRGYDANMTFGRTKNVDILVSDPKTEKMYKLEVRTNYYFPDSDTVGESKNFSKYATDWIMDEKHENITDPKLFYCFVSFNESSYNTRFFIVPSMDVAKYVKGEFSSWLKAKKKEGGKGKNDDMRLFRIGVSGVKYDYIKTPTPEKYENNWEFKA